MPGAAMSASIIPIAGASKTQHTCDQLGICQGRTIPCLNCTQTTAPQWQPDDEIACTPIEHMGYWLTVGIVAAITVAVLVGTASYIYFRFFA
jgi:hypothetical protein